MKRVTGSTNSRNEMRGKILVLANSIAIQINGRQDIVSGAINTWVRDALHAPEPFVILCPDKTQYQLGNATIVPISDGIDCMDPELGRRFNGSGGWQIMHSGAYSDFYPQDVLRSMFEQAGVSTEPEIFRSFATFIEKTQPDAAVEERFLDRFSEPLDAIQEGSVVSFEGSKIVGLPLRYAQRLRRRGVRTVVRWHESIPEPERLLSFSWGHRAVSSFSCADKVMLHTREYKQRLNSCFDALGIKEPPELSTYRLGIDVMKFSREVGLLNATNVKSELGGPSSLSQRQRNLLTEAIATRHTVPHRWVVADALDPTKGSIQIYQAIREFLRSESERLQYADLLKRYRFFIVQSPRFLSDTSDPFNMNVAYQRVALTELQRIERDFPGVIHSCECFRGENYKALTAIYEYSTALSGGIGEGLNLVVPECLYVNYLLPNSLNHGIIGNRAGFAMECLDRGAGRYGFFPKAGDVLDFVGSMRRLVEMRESNPEELRRMLCSLVETEVLDRRDSVIDIS